MLTGGTHTLGVGAAGKDSGNVREGDEVAGGSDGATKGQAWGDVVVEELSEGFKYLKSNARVALEECVDSN